MSIGTKPTCATPPNLRNRNSKDSGDTSPLIPTSTGLNNNQIRLKFQEHTDKVDYTSVYEKFNIKPKIAMGLRYESDSFLSQQNAGNLTEI